MHARCRNAIASPSPLCHRSGTCDQVKAVNEAGAALHGGEHAAFFYQCTFSQR